MRFALAFAITTSAALQFAPTHAHATDDVPNVLPPPDHGARTLRGHTFIEPSTQETPFITSHVGVRQGLSYLSVPNFPVSQDVRTNLVIFALTERLDLQVRILPWLALHAAGEASVATGLDQESLFYGQSTALGGGRGGAAIRLFRSRESGTQVTLRGYGGASVGNELALPGFVDAIAVRASREISGPFPATVDEAKRRLNRAVATLSNAAIADVRVTTFGGSLHLAQTVVRAVGLQTSFAVAQRNAADRRFDPDAQRHVTTDTMDTSIRFGATASFDAYHVGMPLALLTEYAVEKTYRSVEHATEYVPSAHFLGVGLYYSGRTDLQLGASAFVRRNLKAQDATAIDGTRATTGIPTSVYGQFVVRYVWN